MVVINCAALPRQPDRERAVRPREGRLHRRRHRRRRACSRRATAARCSSTRSASCRLRRRPRCCACSRPSASRAWARPREIEVDVRIIAATHRDLEAMVEAQHVPRGPLLPPEHDDPQGAAAARPARGDRAARARVSWRQTVGALEHLGARLRAADAGDPAARYHWPGNVRELRNVIERAAVICTGRAARARGSARALAFARVGSCAGRWPDGQASTDSALSAPVARPSRRGRGSGRGPVPDRIRDYEVKLITDALDAAAGNQSRAAEILQMPLRTLVHKIKAYGLKKPWKREDE